MKNKHTGGKWTIGGHSQGSGENWREIITDAEPFNGSLVATCLLRDANLIASAPELLDCLIILENVCRNALDISATNDGLKNCEILAKARLAISKAKVEA